MKLSRSASLATSPGGTPAVGNSWWGCAARFSKSSPDLRPKNVIFHTRFQTWPSGKCHHLEIRVQTKNFFKCTFRIRIFLLRSYSFRTETIKTFIHSRGSLENYPRFQIKMSKVYTCFQTKKGY